MSTAVHVTRNEGVINTGSNSISQIYNINKENQRADDINWKSLNKEINILKSNPDLSIQKFAKEAETAAEKKDKHAIFCVLSKWIPCIADLISSSYYMIEIAKNFNIY